VRAADRPPHTLNRSEERLFLALAVGAVLFAAYVSFVPFHVAPGVTLHDAMGALGRHRAWRLGSRSNFAGNVILYLPVGFFAAGALCGRPRRAMARVAISGMILLLSLASSIVIESLQAFLPSRVPAVSDVAAQTAGALIGILIWFIVAPDVHAWWARRRTGTPAPIRHGWLAVYLAAYGAAALLPLDVTLDVGTIARKWRMGRIVLDPLASASWTWNLLPALLGDVVLAVPIGLLASVAGVGAGRRRGALAALFIGGAAITIIEAAQVFVISRTADSADALVAFAGVLAGVAIAAAIVPAAGGAAPRRRPLTWSLAGLGAAVSVYVAYNWSPFDFVVSVATFHERLPAFWRPPFYAYYQNSELKAVGDTLIKLAMSAPLGFFWALWCGRRLGGFQRAAFVAGLAGVVVFATIVELGQVLLPSRYPDMTDVLLASAGFVIGHAIARALLARAAAGSASGDSRWARALDSLGE
jgi:VanZ family protein